MTFNIVWKLVRGDAKPFIERPTVLEVESARGMIARFDAIEQFAAGSTGAQRINGADPAGNRSESAGHPSGSRTGCLGDPGPPDLANQPDPADLVRVARVQALIATSAVVASEAAARRGEIDPVVGVFWVPYSASHHPFHGQVMHLDMSPIEIVDRTAGEARSTLA